MTEGTKFPLAPMGVLAPRLRTLDGPLVPPSTQAEIFRRTCLGGGKFSKYFSDQFSRQIRQFWALFVFFKNLSVILQTRAPKNFRSCRWGDERTVKRAQTGSKDPHRRERKFNKSFSKKFLCFYSFIFLISYNVTPLYIHCKVQYKISTLDVFVKMLSRLCIFQSGLLECAWKLTL